MFSAAKASGTTYDPRVAKPGSTKKYQTAPEFDGKYQQTTLVSELAGNGRLVLNCGRKRETGRGVPGRIGSRLSPQMHCAGGETE
eukprot:3161799-Rhodomonas_salina.2